MFLKYKTLKKVLWGLGAVVLLISASFIVRQCNKPPVVSVDDPVIVRPGGLPPLYPRDVVVVAEPPDSLGNVKTRKVRISGGRKVREVVTVKAADIDTYIAVTEPKDILFPDFRKRGTVVRQIDGDGGITTVVQKRPLLALAPGVAVGVAYDGRLLPSASATLLRVGPMYGGVSVSYAARPDSTPEIYYGAEVSVKVRRNLTLSVGHHFNDNSPGYAAIRYRF